MSTTLTHPRPSTRGSARASRRAPRPLAEAGLVAALAFTFLAGPVAEEFGRRGYVQPRLRQHHGRPATTAALGSAWVPAAILVHAAWNLTDELVPPSGTGGQWLQLLILTAIASLVTLLWRQPPVSPSGE
jgi:membrane protease YdiL (CAAX protease family)